MSANPFLYLALAQVVVATVGSLYFSEIAGLPPCLLCWYQRILIYPLVVIIAVGIVKKDNSLPFYVLPFSFLGIIIAGYHYLLQRGVLPEAQVSCSLGISCTTQYIEWLGFITIPLLSFTAFTIVTLCMIIYYQLTRKDESRN